MKCQCTDPNIPADPSMECYVNSPNHYNCIYVYAHYMQGKEHTLHECAALMNVSHTTIKQIELSALKKIREILASGDTSAKSLSSILKSIKN